MNSENSTDLYRLFASHICESKFTVVLTGAGISTESGIPDFRSPNGVWATNRQVYFDEFLSDSEARYEYWRQKSVSHREFADSVPNVGHRTIVKWQKQGLVERVITQNIDGLHQQAGSEDVIEIHGTARRVACLSCGWNEDAEVMVQRFLANDACPKCDECGGITKHATISFGQQLNETVMQDTIDTLRMAELVIALGTSLAVEPAASIPWINNSPRRKVAIVNREQTGKDHLADIVIHGELGVTLTEIDKHVEHAMMAD